MNEHYEVGNRLVGNDYAAKYHLEALASMFEVAWKENLNSSRC